MGGEKKTIEKVKREGNNTNKIQERESNSLEVYQRENPTKFKKNAESEAMLTISLVTRFSRPNVSGEKCDELFILFPNSLFNFFYQMFHSSFSFSYLLFCN